MPPKKPNPDFATKKDAKGFTELDYEDFFNLIQDGDVAAVKKVLARGPNLKREDDGAWTALHWAAFSGNKEIVNLIIEAGAVIDACDTFLEGWSPLHVATYRGHEDIANVLIKGGARVDRADKLGMTPLHVAALVSHEGIVEALIAAGASEQAQDNDGHIPSDLSDDERVQRLLSTKGSDKKLASAPVERKPSPAPTAAAVPAPSSSSGDTDLTQFLDRLQIAHIADIFHEKGITYNKLIVMKEDNLKDLGIPMGPRKKLWNELQKMVPEKITSISALLRKCKLEKYQKHFDREEINLELAKEMEKQDFTELGLTTSDAQLLYQELKLIE